MPCYHPLEAWRGPLLPSGKRSVVFKARESTPGLSAFPQKLPCGQCVGCKLDYSLDWAVRLMHERQMHKDSCFITLTYAPEKLPKPLSCLRCKKTFIGEVHMCDFQLFMKRLRRFFRGQKISFYHAGEYGELFGRPHFHAVVFGVDFDDKVLFKVGGSGCKLYTSRKLSQLWPFGFASVGEVTFESAAYVARYCLKKVMTLNERFEEGGRKFDVVVKTGEIRSPEYVTMSRRPGLGSTWFEKFGSDVYPADSVVLRGGRKMPPPRFYDGRYELKNSLDMERIKLHRVGRCTKSEDVWSDVLQKVQRLDVNRSDRLAVMEEVKLSEISKLKRKVD